MYERCSSWVERGRWSLNEDAFSSLEEARLHLEGAGVTLTWPRSGERLLRLRMDWGWGGNRHVGSANYSGMSVEFWVIQSLRCHIDPEVAVFPQGPLVSLFDTLGPGGSGKSGNPPVVPSVSRRNQSPPQPSETNQCGPYSSIKPGHLSLGP